ncbi:MAG: hypothetical protein KC418_17455 [Anaerolineales bacterium]|nr:hypothetical protein [Anaerolineales bacterium]MCB8953601.1 hypothetical protein [Ardenticatenales bacterium]
MDQLAKSKMKEFNAKSIFLFFLIAFGWTWFWWFPILYLFTRYGSQLFFGLQQPPLIYVSTPWLIIPPFIASILNGGLSKSSVGGGTLCRIFRQSGVHQHLL